MSNSTKQCIQDAIASNAGCSAGILGRAEVLETASGPSGGPELLALLFIDEQHLGYWYGHIRKHPRSGKFLALIVRMSVFVNAPTLPLLFSRFDYWTRIRLAYTPCAVQRLHDAYAETDSYECAAATLADMIERFNIEHRGPEEDSPHHDDRLEMRVMSVFGIEDHADENGVLPPPPSMSAPMRIASSR